MISNGIQGFTPLQKELADRIWSMDTQAELEQYVDMLPKNLKREAYVVMHMIIASELDNHMEVSQDVQAYIRSL